MLISIPIVFVGCGYREQELEVRLGHRHREDAIMVTGGRPDSDGVLIVPAYIDGLPVVAIGARAFNRNTSLRRVVIPYTIEVIEGMAFTDCTRLEEVTFEEGSRLRSIEVTGFAGAFANTTRLRSIVLPEGLEYIGASAFARSGLESVNIPNTVSHICSAAFSLITNVESITIPYSVTTIYSSAFAGWTANQTIYVEGRTEPGENWSEQWLGWLEIEVNVVFLGGTNI